MTYSALLQEEGINRQYLAVLSPRRKAATFPTVAGSVYSQVFDYGHVSGVSVDGTSLVEGVSATLSAGQFYFDFDSNILYVRTSGSDNPNSYFVVITYELYVGTFDAHWHRVPTDVATRVVYFDPLIQRSPTIKSSVSDSLFGFLPVQTSSIVLANAEHTLERHIYDSSFSKAGLKLYHWLGDLAAANFKLVYDGYTGNVNSSSNKVSISTLDRVDLFRTQYRNLDESFYTKALFPDLDPNYDVAPIRYVYGLVNGFTPVNVSYENEEPTTADNRSWAVMGEQVNLNNVTATVAAAPASTATRTYLNSAQGFVEKDSVWFDRAAGTDEYKIITNVNYVSNYIEHEALAGAMTSGDSCKRSFVGNITILQGESVFKPLFGRDYTSNGSMSGGVSGFTFVNNFEANHAGMATLSPNDRVSCRVYGRKKDLTIGGNPFGSNDSKTGNLTSPIGVLYDLIVNSLGVEESQVDTTTFQTLESANMEAIGFAIPTNSRESFLSYKDLIVKILKSTLIRIFVNNDNKWTIAKLAPIVSTTSAIDDTEILENSFEYQFNYSELISDAIVKYDLRESSESLGLAEQTFSQVVATNYTAKYVHGVDKQETFDSLHFREVDAQKLADRLSYALGDRLGVAKFDSKRLYELLINQKIQVSRTRLPGFEYAEEVERTRNFAVTEVEKSLRVIQIETEDQKGIQDNSGNW